MISGFLLNFRMNKSWILIEIGKINFSLKIFLFQNFRNFGLFFFIIIQMLYFQPEMGSESDAVMLPTGSVDRDSVAGTAARIFFTLIGFCQNSMNGVPKERQLAIFQQHWATLFILQAAESRAITARQIKNELALAATSTAKQRSEVGL